MSNGRESHGPVHTTGSGKYNHEEEKMADKPITVTARMRAKEGMEDQVKGELLALIPPTRAESGCMAYELHRSMKDPGLFLFYEKWKSKEDLGAHAKAPHMKEFIGKAGEMLAGPAEIMLWELVG
jgi:quinol monooxygenase YgiN